ncbi:MAG: AAA family ATPase [Desulfobacterales bacterium]
MDEWLWQTVREFRTHGGASLLTQSHGQSTMAYFRSMYHRKGLFFMDEPEAALSPRTQLDLLDLIREESRKGSAQFIISTHSPILMSCEEAEIFSFDRPSISRVALKETSHYQVFEELFKNGFKSQHL